MGWWKERKATPRYTEIKKPIGIGLGLNQRKYKWIK